jgi:SAM-dependent methyltransferase
MELSRHYAKTCDLPDFSDPEMAATITDIVPVASEVPPHRKYWEFASAALFFRDAGVLREDAKILDVGAGHEELLYWLARHAGRVYALDIYGRGEFAGLEADRAFVENPAAFAPYPYPEDRLEVVDADARSLPFEDESIDAVVSCSSVEHMGDLRDLNTVMSEVRRVLRPGGVAYIATEVFLKWSPLNARPVGVLAKALSGGRRAPGATRRKRAIDVLTPGEIRRHLVRGTGLELMQPLRIEVSEEARRHPVRVLGVDKVEAHDGRPHIVVAVPGGSFTSIGLPLRRT